MQRDVFTVDGILKLHAWTHASFGLMLDHLSLFSVDAYGRDLPGFGFSSVRRQVVHICNCEGFWVQVLQGRVFVDRDAAAYPQVADARVLREEVSEGTRVYLSKLTTEDLNRDAELRFSDGDVAVRTPALVLHHVLTHAFHHKGQVAAMCRVLGRPMPDTDLNQFE